MSQRLADRVFAIYDSNAQTYSAAGIPLATSGGFVIGDHGVLFVEHDQPSALLPGRALVREQTDKPITHVINTSSHGDHSFGNAFLPPACTSSSTSAPPSTSPRTSRRHRLYEDELRQRPGPRRATSRRGRHPVGDSTPFVLDLGGIEVSARYYGFAQTGGDLFVHVPSAKIVLTGNPLVAAQPAVPGCWPATPAR